MDTKDTRRRGCLLWLAAALLLLLALALLRVPLLRGIGTWLVVDEAPVRADAILLLNGEENTRPLHAARLWQAGYAPVIVIARATDEPVLHLIRQNATDAATTLLMRNGVPSSAIIELRTPGGVSSTQDEGRAFASWAQRHPDVDTVLVVTSDFHGRRTRWVLRRALPSTHVAMSTVEHFAFDETNWWRTEWGLLFYIEEYIKFLHYWLND